MEGFEHRGRGKHCECVTAENIAFHGDVRAFKVLNFNDPTPLHWLRLVQKVHRRRVERSILQDVVLPGCPGLHALVRQGCLMERRSVILPAGLQIPVPYECS